MEVAIDFLAVALGHHRLKRRGSLLKGRARLGRIAAKLAKPRPRPSRA
jgi:hypothetical protein